MRKYTIDFFGEKELGYFGTLEGAKDYADQHCHGFGMKRLSIIIKDGNRIVGTQDWEIKTDEVGVYYDPQEWR